MALQIEVADDFRIEQADGVARSRVPEAGQEFVRDRGASDRVGSLQHGDLQSLGCQVISAGQAIMARADDYDVELHLIPTGVRKRL
jgi:hypothetical protein